MICATLARKRLIFLRTVTVLRTLVETEQGLVRTTPVTTLTETVTEGGMAKRDAQVTPAPLYMERSEYIQMFRRQAANASALPQNDADIEQNLSSACLCQTYVGTTITETYTNQPDVSD